MLGEITLSAKTSTPTGRWWWDTATERALASMPSAGPAPVWSTSALCWGELLSRLWRQRRRDGGGGIRRRNGLWQSCLPLDQRRYGRPRHYAGGKLLSRLWRQRRRRGGGGYGDGTGFGNHAFRWTSAGMADLGTMLGGSYSLGYGVSADGAVVVGYGDGTGFSQHAFRWTSAGMEDLGTMTGGTYSVMLWGVSADGTVVVGYGDGTGFGNHAFRWTAATGMRDLNTLLADAGVNMTGITLVAAYDVSANGQFIVGQGDFSGATRAYIVRYLDQGIAGLTTPGAVQELINELGDARFGLMAQEHGLAVPLLGDNQPIKQGSEAGVFGTAGSAQGGGYSRIGLTPGLALLCRRLLWQRRVRQRRHRQFLHRRGGAALCQAQPRELASLRRGRRLDRAERRPHIRADLYERRRHRHRHRPHRGRRLLCLRPRRAGVRSRPPASARAVGGARARMARCRRL